MKDTLRKHLDADTQDWLSALPHVRAAYMSKMHRMLGVSPNEMLLGFQPKLPLPIPGLRMGGVASVEYVQELRDILEDVDKRNFEILKLQMGATAKACFKRRQTGREAIHAGDWVLELKTTKSSFEVQCQWSILGRAAPQQRVCGALHGVHGLQGGEDIHPSHSQACQVLCDGRDLNK
jgi:hypothetical protein